MNILDIGFVILSPEPNVGRLKSTIRSIDRNFGKSTPRLCVFAKKTPPSVIKEIKEICPALRGQDTITSLINIGISKGHKEWNIIVMEGVSVSANIQHKYAIFLKDEKDIFFPIVPDYDRDGIPTKLNNNFPEATLNGLCIHQNTFNKIGNFPNYDNFELSKLNWAMGAITNGCKFKAILGVRMC